MALFDWVSRLLMVFLAKVSASHERYDAVLFCFVFVFGQTETGNNIPAWSTTTATAR